jgi:hypothetical protein
MFLGTQISKPKGELRLRLPLPINYIIEFAMIEYHAMNMINGVFWLPNTRKNSISYYLRFTFLVLLWDFTILIIKYGNT